MKCLPSLSLVTMLLFGALPPAVGDNAVPQDTVPADDGDDGELDLAVQMTVHAFREQLAALRSMQDTASTVAATERLRKAICLRYKLYCMSFDYDQYKERCTAQLGALEDDCRHELARLSENDFFGVMPVRAIFCSDKTTLASFGENLRCATPLSQEERNALAESRKVAIERYLEKNTWMEGGPGFSRDCAWVIRAEQNAIPRERHLLQALWQRNYCGQSLHSVDGRIYDCLYIVLTRDGEPCRMEQWFDITAYWNAQSKLPQP